MNKSEQVNEIAKALCIAFGEVRDAVKDSKNPFFKSDYADLRSVTSAYKPAFIKNGLCLVQLGDNENLETIIMHSSGQWISGSLKIPMKDNSPQGLGSSLTYLRRYMAAAAAGVVTTDDDGEAAMGRNAPKASFTEIQKDLLAQKQLEAFRATWETYSDTIDALPAYQKQQLITMKDKAKVELR